MLKKSIIAAFLLALIISHVLHIEIDTGGIQSDGNLWRLLAGTYFSRMELEKNTGTNGRVYFVFLWERRFTSF